MSDTILMDNLFLVMNLCEIENHARSSYISTKKEVYLKILNIIRNKRMKYMEALEKGNKEGQLHCLNKHLLSASFRAFEIGDKLLDENKIEESKECYLDGDKFLEIFAELNWTEDKIEKKSFIGKLIKK